MSKSRKLWRKLKDGTIDANELRTLLEQNDWSLHRQSGSHEIWKNGPERFVLACHSKDLKLYQIKLARKILGI